MEYYAERTFLKFGVLLGTEEQREKALEKQARRRQLSLESAAAYKALIERTITHPAKSVNTVRRHVRELPPVPPCQQPDPEYSRADQLKLLVILAITFIFFLVEIIIGYKTNSTTLMADSFHMMSDVAALLVAFGSIQVSRKKWSRVTFGWARAEVLGALVNAIFLVALCFSILIAAIKRFINVEEIQNPVLILVVGVIGLVLNLTGLCMFIYHHRKGGHTHHHRIPQHQTRVIQIVTRDANVPVNNAPPVPTELQPASSSKMNIRGVCLYLLADALGSVIVIISALVIWLTNWSWKLYVDPLLSVIMVILILSSVWPLLQESAMILLQTVPSYIQVDELERRLIAEVEGVIAVHEFHVWQLANDKIIASAHIRCHDLADYIEIAEKVKVFFHNEGIHHTTIQPEFDEQYPDFLNPNNSVCLLACPSSMQACITNSCCGRLRTRDSMDSVDIQNQFVPGNMYDDSARNEHRSIHVLPSNIITINDENSLPVGVDIRQGSGSFLPDEILLIYPNPREPPKEKPDTNAPDASRNSH